MLEREHFAAAAKPALHFISDKKNSVFSSDLFEARQEFLWRHDVSAFSLNRFHNDRSDLAWIHRRLENDIFQIIAISIGNVRHTRNERPEPFPLNRLR